MAVNPPIGIRPTLKGVQYDHIATQHSPERGQQTKGAFRDDPNEEKVRGWIQTVLNQYFDNDLLTENLVGQRVTLRGDTGETTGWSRNSGELTQRIEFVCAFNNSGQTDVFTAYPA